MSLDAKYIFFYEPLGYLEPTPMQKDIQFLKEKHGGYFEILEKECTVFWDKPKHTLTEKDTNELYADQILERFDGEKWHIVR